MVSSLRHYLKDIKVRDNHRVVSKAFHVILGIDEERSHGLLSFAIHESESYEKMYENLLARGLRGLKLVISDSHKGEVKAIRDTFFRRILATMPSSHYEKCF